MSPRFEAQAMPGGVPVIAGYSAGGFRIGGEAMTGAVLVLPTGAVTWPVASLDALLPDDFAAVGPDIEVLLLGTGATMQRPPRSLLDALKARHLPLDFMDSRAAARTYNVLVGEGRRVAAVLLPL